MDAIKCEAFLRTVDTGSFSAAAEQLDYTPSGINRMVTALETELGFPLLTRTRTGVELTRNGATMLPALRQFLHDNEQISQLAGEIVGVIRGNLDIGSYYSVASSWLPGILKEFKKDYPGITVATFEASTSELREKLDDRSLDCCFLGSPVPGTDWIPLKEDQLTVWLPADHPKAGLSAFPLHDIDGEPFIWPMPNREVDIANLCKEDGLKPDVRYTTYDDYTAYSMVAAGLGISINNELMAQNWTGDVVVMPFDPPRTITLGVAIPSLRDASPATLRFLSCAKDYVEGI